MRDGRIVPCLRALQDGDLHRVHAGALPARIRARGDVVIPDPRSANDDDEHKKAANQAADPLRQV
jgi:hypothetical protein